MQQAQKLFQRLCEIEKIDIRAANDARLDFLGQTDYQADLPLLSADERLSILQEVKALCLIESAKLSSTDAFPATWKF